MGDERPPRAPLPRERLRPWALKAADAASGAKFPSRCYSVPRCGPFPQGIVIQRSIAEDLPVVCKPQTCSNDLIEGPFGIDERVSAARKIVAQFGFDVVRGGPRMVAGVAPFSNALCKHVWQSRTSRPCW